MINSLIVAHRGDSGSAPESTLPAFEAAIAKGADAIEFDVHITRCGKPVIHHDAYLGRTEPARGFIGDYTLTELQALDVGSWFDHRFQGARMPTLPEVLALGKDDVRFEIEIHSPSLKLLNAVIDLVAARNAELNVELTSSHIPLLCHVPRINPMIRTGMFFDPLPDWMPAPQRREQIISWLRLSGAHVAHLPMSMIDPGLINVAHEAGFLIHAFNLDTQAEILTALELGVDQFSTDDLDLALRTCGRYT